MEMSAQIEVSAMMDSMVTELVRVWSISVELLVRLENVHQRAPRRQVRVRSVRARSARIFIISHFHVSIASEEYHPHGSLIPQERNHSKNSTLEYKLDCDENLTRASRSNTGTWIYREMRFHDHSSARMYVVFETINARIQTPL